MTNSPGTDGQIYRELPLPRSVHGFEEAVEEVAAVGPGVAAAEDCVGYLLS